MSGGANMLNESTTLRVGDRAPDFSLPDARGQMQVLADYTSRGPVLVAFHRGTW
ncbi:MAG TPA: hypothetical protein VF198_02035 [Vicinamibacterales bacterium]